MNSGDVGAVIKNLESIGLTSKYNSGSLTPMGPNGPTANPFLGNAEPGAAYLSTVVRGGRRGRRRVSRRGKSRRQTRRRNRR